MEIICQEDCGNAPKKLMLKDLNIAFANGDTESIMATVTDDIVWELVSEQRIEGKDRFSSMLDSIKNYTASKLVIDNIITHGKTAAVNGVMHMNDGKQYAFCDVYVFNSASKSGKIKTITSYCIEI